jgi:predicted MPP superfamily phosphohydrolase
VATVFGLVHAAIWWRLVGAPQLSGWPAALLTSALVALYASVPLALASRFLGWVPLAVKSLGFAWVGVLFYWFSLSILAEPVFQLGRYIRPDLYWGSGLAVAVVLLGSLVSFFAARGAAAPAIVRVDVPIPGLDPRLDGFRIAQLTDVHIGPTVDRDFVADVVRRINAESVDMVAITGDLVDGGVAELRPSIEPLYSLKSQHGSFFVTGNHEYYAGAAAWCTELSSRGIRVLRNERVLLSHAGAPIEIGGVDDAFAHGDGHHPDLNQALAGTIAGRALVFLAHQPSLGVQAAQRGASLVLSGHTHGGQLWPFVHLVKLVQPLVAGLARVGGGWVYVSRGTAWWGPKMRLGAPNELTILRLQAA